MIIEDGAFDGCKTINEIDLGSSVVSIGDYAFSGCISIKEIVIPDSVNTIGANAFFNCQNVTSLTIGKGVTSIGYGAFEHCSKIENIYYNAVSVKAFENNNHVFSSVGSGTPGVNAVFGSSVESLPAYLFASSEKNTPILRKLTFNNSSALLIGENAFKYSKSISEIYISSLEDWLNIEFGNASANPLSVASSFYVNDRELNKVQIPLGIEKINDYAFYNYDALTSVTLSGGVTHVGTLAFSGCDKLESISIGLDVATIGSLAFSDCPSLAEIEYDSIVMDDLFSANDIFANSGSDNVTVTRITSSTLRKAHIPLPTLPRLISRLTVSAKRSATMRSTVALIFPR